MIITSPLKSMSPAKRYGWASAWLLITMAVWRQPLEASMLLHMLVQIPGILVSGVVAAYAMRAASGAPARADAGRGLGRLWAQYQTFNEFGVPGILFASIVGGYWMIPKALDQVLAVPSVDALKFLVLFLTGMLLMDSLTRANTVIKLFFAGNFSWMMALVGILYQETPARLCNYYLWNDQEQTGIALVVLAALLPVLWLLIEIKTVKRYLLR